MAPKNDERGLPWQFNEQRTMFIEMDRFATTRTFQLTYTNQK